MPVWRIILEQSWNLKTNLRPRRPVGTTCSSSDGLMALFVLAAAAKEVGRERGAPDLSGVQASRVCDCWDYFSGYAKTVADVVPGSLACHQSEEGRERGESPASPWPGQLFDRMDVAAQTSSSYGSS
jgi:hypothetical protein